MSQYHIGRLSGLRFAQDDERDKLIGGSGGFGGNGSGGGVGVGLGGGGSIVNIAISFLP